MAASEPGQLISSPLVAQKVPNEASIVPTINCRALRESTHD